MLGTPAFDWVGEKYHPRSFESPMNKSLSSPTVIREKRYPGIRQGYSDEEAYWDSRYDAEDQGVDEEEEDEPLQVPVSIFLFIYFLLSSR